MDIRVAFVLLCR